MVFDHGYRCHHLAEEASSQAQEVILRGAVRGISQVGRHLLPCVGSEYRCGRSSGSWIVGGGD